MRYCSRCWEERLEWLPDKQNDRPTPPRRRKPKKQFLERYIAGLSEESFSPQEVFISILTLPVTGVQLLAFTLHNYKLILKHNIIGILPNE